MSKYLTRSGENNTFTINDLLPAIKINESGCWIWQRHIGKSGYHEAGVNGKILRVHRIVAEIVYGAAPKGHFALHSCDIKTCVNPDHLRWGTQKQNMEDAVKRKRVRTGQNASWSKLTWEMVEELRLIDLSTTTLDEIAKNYPVSRTTIWRAMTGISWKTR
jgi:hypothetical protein